jgi:NitT/TauT family transport system permease protein
MTTESLSLGAGASGPSLWRRLADGRTFPVVVVVAAIVVVWYLACIPMNADAVARTAPDATGLDRVLLSFEQTRPVLPAPHQVFAEMWRTTVLVDPTSRRSLLYHAWVTLSAALVGFALGTAIGIGLAVLIVHIRSLQKSLMPWVIASQTIPILAIAPIVVVVMGRPPLNLTGLVPKALIATYLCYFPVAIGMVKGLSSPDPMQLDLMRTYNASASQVFWKLRWPSSVPFLFTSLKVGIASSVVAAIVAEMPTGALAGLGSRLLAGSQFGQMLQIWAALFMAAILAAALVALIGLVERHTLRLMGARPEAEG